MPLPEASISAISAAVAGDGHKQASSEGGKGSDGDAMGEMCEDGHTCGGGESEDSMGEETSGGIEESEGYQVSSVVTAATLT